MATEFYVTVEGAKLGRFAGETAPGPNENKIAGIGFQYGVNSPRDGLAGQSSGRRVHQTVTFVKQWGAATPQFFQTIVNNELLKSVHFEFLRVNDSGDEVVFHTVKLHQRHRRQPRAVHGRWILGVRRPAPARQDLDVLPADRDLQR